MGRCSPDATHSSRVTSAAESLPEGRRVRVRVLALALGAALAMTALFAPSAFAVRKVGIAFSCGSTTFTYSGFPDSPNNTVTERLKSDGVTQFNEKFSFNGSSGSSTIESSLPAGRHKLTAEAHWKTNGVTGESGRHKEHVTCGAEPMPAFNIQKLQQIAGSGLGFTAVPINGHVGETVEYQINVSNIGNVAFTLSEFADPNCDPGTLAGGSGEAPVAPGASATWTCTHLLSTGGPYTNVASVTANFEEGLPVSHESNKVVVNVPPVARMALEKTQEIKGSGTGFTASTLTAGVGQTVLYQIVAKNTGNLPLTLSEFTDIYCDENTISGGPGANPLTPGASTTYTCSHQMTETGPYSNIASVKGSNAAVDPVIVASNMVTVKVNSAEPPAGTPGAPAPGTTTGGSGAVGGVGGSGSSGGTSKPGSSGSLGTQSKKKKHRRVTVAHKTPHFTG